MRKHRLLSVARIDSKHRQHLRQRHFEDQGQALDFVDSRSTAVFNIEQSRVPDVVILVALAVGDNSTLPLDIARL